MKKHFENDEDWLLDNCDFGCEIRGRKISPNFVDKTNSIVSVNYQGETGD